MIIALALGIACAVGMERSHWFRMAGLTYVEMVRNTPFLVQIFIFYFGLPAIGLNIPPSYCAVIGLAVYGGAYVAEIVRAGLESVPRGQIEAAKALRMPPWTILKSIVLKPALASVYRPLTGQFVLLLQSSSLLSAISVAELTAVGNTIQSLTYRNFEAYLFIAAFYLVLTTLFRVAFDLIGRQSFRFQRIGG